MQVVANLPKLEARDLRPDILPEQSYTISSAHKASFLMLDVSAPAGPYRLRHLVARTIEPGLPLRGHNAKLCSVGSCAEWTARVC